MLRAPIKRINLFLPHKLAAGGFFMEDEVFSALLALLSAEELTAKRAHLAANTLTDGVLAEGMARLAASASDRHAALLSIAEGYDET